MTENISIAGNILTDEQQKVVNEESKGELINITGYAGSGKTFTLLGKILKYAQKTNDSLIYLVYTNAMANNIKEMLLSLGLDEMRVTVKTMDTFCMEAYESACPNTKMTRVEKENEIPWMEKARNEAKKRAGIMGYDWSMRLNSMTSHDWLDECTWMANMGVPIDDSGLDILKELERGNRAKIHYETDTDRETAFFVYQIYNHILRNRGEVSRENKYKTGFCIPEFFSLEALQHVG